jgi:phospholipid transport system substrate-binding protein
MKLSISILVIGLCCGTVQANEATAVLRDAVENVLAILNDPELAAPENEASQRIQATAAFAGIVNFREAAKHSIGKPWNDLTREQRNAFVPLFKGMLEATYYNSIAEHADAEIEYVGEAQLKREGHVVVQTKIAAVVRQVAVDYRMRKHNEDWRVYEVIIDGVGVVKNYRTQFRPVLKKDGFEALLVQLQAKADGSQ